VQAAASDMQAGADRQASPETAGAQA
jgi:hypothetical protein